LVLLDEGATWTGVGALAVAALLLAVGIILFARWRRAAAREIAQIQTTGERTEKLLTELTRALGDAREEAGRLAAMGEVGVTLDLDESLERALRAVSELAEADAALIVLGEREGEPITASHGLTAEESTRDLLGLPPETRRARAVKLGYLYSADEAVNDAFRLAGGLAVPLSNDEGERVGSLAVFWRRADRSVDEHELGRFEEVAAAFGPTLEHARLYSEARRLADTDPLTNLKNRRYFDERLRREVARARRYERALGLLVVEAEGLTDFAPAGDRIQGAVRGTDVAAHLGDGLFAVIMPEAGQPDAERLHRRLQFALGGRVDNGDEGIRRLHAGLVELRREDDAGMLLRRAQAALERAKEAAVEELTAAQARSRARTITGGRPATSRASRS
jgi:diguanylate cyclase (GGDEF)-like protein